MIKGFVYVKLVVITVFFFFVSLKSFPALTEFSIFHFNRIFLFLEKARARKL